MADSETLGEPGGILDRLSNDKVFNVTRDGDGFWFEESCDNYYVCRLTADEVLRLADELRALVTPPRIQS